MTDFEPIPDTVRGLIFDCDGTLVNTLPVYAQAWAAGFRAAGEHIEPEWYLARAGMSEYVLMDAFEAERGITLQRAAVVEAMRGAFLQELHRLQEIEAVVAVARRNQGARPMAVASGGSRAVVEATLQATGLRALFDTVVTIDDVGRAKPAPDLFLEAARRLGEPPASCLVFEDSREGLEAARRAGMAAIDVMSALRSTPA